jgi:hypothetical protein
MPQLWGNEPILGLNNKPVGIGCMQQSNRP